MPYPTTARGLLGHFPQDADPPAAEQRATNPPIRLPTSLSLQAISAAADGGRGAWGGASGRKGPREEGGRSAGEGGRNGDETGWPRGEAGTGGRTTATRRRKIAEKARRRWGHDHKQVIIDSDGGERRVRGDDQEGSNNTS